MSSQIERIQEDIFGRISQDEFFADIKVYLFRPRSQEEAVQIQTDIDAALAGLETKATKSGAAVIVQMPNANVPLPNVPGPRFDLIYTIRVLENPLINMGATGTSKSAEEIALSILNLCHHFTLQDFGMALVASGEALKALGIDESGRIGYDCLLTMPMGLAKSIKVIAPSITGTAASVTITTATSGATILYTIDGSYPWAGNATALTYSAPFAVTSGVKVRSVATKAGLQPSDLSAKTMT